MGNHIDLLGQEFGKLTVLERLHNNKWGRTVWLCACECGNRKVIAGADLKHGHVKSCGCFQKEFGSIVGKNNAKHEHCVGGKSTSEYKTWSGMISRCYNEKNPSYSYYGGRGIRVYDIWRNSFEDFFKDMGKRPSNKHSLDRINNNGNYEPKNCRWATEQNLNKRRFALQGFSDEDLITEIKRRGLSC